MNLTDLLRRLTGVSTPFVGVSWTPAPDERVIIYALIQKLGDRRLIRHSHGGFEYNAVIRSCEIIRANLTEALTALPPESPARETLEEIREALHLFQTLVEEQYPPERYPRDHERAEAYPTDDLLSALHSVREYVGARLAHLGRVHNIPLSLGLIDSLNVPKRR